MSIRNEIINKRVLFIPVFSARSYETGIYNLALDGNMARIISMIFMGKPCFATILIPNDVINLDVIIKQLGNQKINVEFIRCKSYGENAYHTRINGQSFANFINDYFPFDEFDIIVIEPNTLADPRYFEHFKIAKLIYWCVASITSKGTPWFVEKFADMDKKIASVMPTECILKTQVEALQGMSYADEKGFYDPSQFDYVTIFFPFRLTDKNYHAEDVRNAINEIREKCNKKFKVLYTDVNDSGLFEDDDVFTYISGQKEVYISILKSKPIIPYLEDSNVLTHINIHEMLYYDCQIIMFENDNYKEYDNVSFIENIKELSNELKRRIENE